MARLAARFARDDPEMRIKSTFYGKVESFFEIFLGEGGTECELVEKEK